MATRTDADTHVGALRSSVTRLRDLAAAISETDLTGRAYPAEWSIAQVLSGVPRYTGKPTGDTTTITVATTDPQRSFTIDLQPESVTFGASTAAAPTDVELPAEAFARLVYGRLDPEHAPPGDHGPALDTLRRVFPGP